MFLDNIQRYAASHPASRHGSVLQETGFLVLHHTIDFKLTNDHKLLMTLSLLTLIYENIIWNFLNPTNNVAKNGDRKVSLLVGSWNGPYCQALSISLSLNLSLSLRDRADTIFTFHHTQQTFYGPYRWLILKCSG